MVITVEDSVTIASKYGSDKYPFVFTEASEEGGLIAYTAVMGEQADIDHHTNSVSSVQGSLSTTPLYIISISASSLSSRVYGGAVRLENHGGLYLAVVFPDWSILDNQEPALRWKFRYVSFEYPRRGKRGFLLPTISISPFACSFVTEAEKEMIEHLCPPLPIARYVPEEFGYEEKELLRYLNENGERARHAGELYPVIGGIFERSHGDTSQYLPMRKQLVPEEYRDYQLLYGADSLGDW